MLIIDYECKEDDEENSSKNKDHMNVDQVDQQIDQHVEEQESFCRKPVISYIISVFMVNWQSFAKY